VLEQTARHYIARAMRGAVNGYRYAVVGAITCEDGEADVLAAVEGGDSFAAEGASGLASVRRSAAPGSVP
jgi:hypothetical protein